MPEVNPLSSPPVGSVEPGVETRGKKFEHETSQDCLKSEYLTLLNSFRVLQDSDYKALGHAHDGLPSCQPPKSFNEKELYGR